VAAGLAVPVEVELVAGAWQPEERDSMQPGSWQRGAPMRFWLAPGERARGTLSSPFEPTAIVVDRRYGCLDFDRTNNVRTLEAPEPGGSPPAGQTTPASR
jgi:hypothetical protein